jgi:hypothetical protein
MNSLNLKEKGFIDAIPLKGLQFTSLPINKDSVLILTDCTVTGQPTSDILYIGKTKKPAKKIFGGYIAGYGGKTTRKIHSLLFTDDFIEKVAISWMTTNNSRAAQKELLVNFKKEHGQYPAWNSAKKPQPQIKAKIKPKATVKKMVKKAIPATKKAKSLKPKTKATR